MSKDSERQAWTRFVEEREREAKRPWAKKRVAKEEVSQAELEAGLDDLITDADRHCSSEADVHVGAGHHLAAMDVRHYVVRGHYRSAPSGPSASPPTPLHKSE